MAQVTDILWTPQHKRGEDRAPMAEREDREQNTSESPRPGARLLAHFELLEELGRGGMGIVYRAKDTRLGRKVAIKLLPAQFAGDPDRRSRFLREARAAAQLNHPNIATLYEVGEADWIPETGEAESGAAEPRKVIFLAMEYVEGQDLAPSLDGDGLSLKQTLDYGIQISDALAAAHSAGVIHRDLKPQNVRITPEGRVKILDFGLAKMVQEGTQVEEPMLTAHGAIVGTAPYMAPEQLQGASEVDSRCDLFSFGVVLYQMLTGRLPFKAQRLVDYVKALTSQTPDPPSKSNPEVSPQLEQVVSRLLEKEPARRYDSAIQVGADLKAIARGQKIEPPPSHTRAGDSIFAEVLQPFRRPWVGWVVGAVFLVALVGVWWGTQSSDKTSTATTEPVKMVFLPPFENLTGDAEKDQICKGLGLALGTAFQEVPVVVVEEEEKAGNLGVPMRLEGFCQRLGEQASVLLRLVDRSNGVMVWSRVIDAPAEKIVPEMTWGAAEALDVAVLPEVRERLDRTPARSVTALTHYFRGLERQNRFDDEQALEEAVTQFREALRLEPDFALAYVGLSEALRRLARKTPSEEMKAEAQEAATKALEMDPGSPAARRALAKFYRDTGQIDLAIAELESLSELQPRDLDIRLQLAQTLFRKGDVQEAAESLDSALTRSGLPAESLWRYWNQLGIYLLELADYEGAAQVYQRARDLAPEDVTMPLENLGSVELFRGQPEAALGWLELIPPEQRSFGALINMGNAHYSLGDLVLAEKMYTQAIAVGPSDPLGYRNRGDVLLELGKLDEARRDYGSAAEAVASQLVIDPSNSRLKSRQMIYLAKSGDCELALRGTQELASTVPTTPEYLLRFAQVFAICGQEGAALGQVREALARGASRTRVCALPELRSLCPVL